MNGKIQEQIFEDMGIIRFPDRLKEAMKKAGGMSNNKLASLTGMSESAIRKYLKGDTYPSLDRLALFADATGCDLAWLSCGRSYEQNNAQKKPFNIAHEGEVTEFISILGRMNREQKEELLNVFYSKGTDLILSLNTGANAVLLSLSEADKQRLVQTHETYIASTEPAKKGAPEERDVNEPGNPTSNKRQAS